MFGTEKPGCESSWAPHILTYVYRRTCKVQAVMWLLHRAVVLQRKQRSCQSHWLSTLVIQNLQNISRVRSLCCPSFVRYGGDSFNPNTIPGWLASKCFNKEIFLALGFVSWWWTCEGKKSFEVSLGDRYCIFTLTQLTRACICDILKLWV